MLEHLKSLATFGMVLRAGSFRGAAERLGMAPSTVSYHVTVLEEFIGAPLLNRSTRRLSPTSLGETLGIQAEAMLASVDGALRLVDEQTGLLRGLLSVTCTSAVIGAGFGEVVALFTRRHADITLRLDVSDSAADLISGRFDLGIRAGRFADSAMKRRRIGAIRRALVCAPTLLQSDGPIRDANDLVGLRWIRLSSMSSRRQLVAPDGDMVELATPTHAEVGSIEAMIELALAGMGVATPPAHLVGAHLATGALVELAPGWQAPPIELQAVWPASRTDSPLRRAFVDHLLDVWAPTLNGPARAR
ncbi:LysR family transcriptional regulator [Maricaulis maris]|uniref:DNA-binding transcriptional LysR family regulator n=1 Tax=Maricaulis maris TaxID=74318 RepID=A0A495DMJ1_9PROT|nr:LysR family transcriptional regulator [Maricaulis maris]RKR04146.1 DNA-binding transcriptional LysR family regulator [Maricaulis maris]